MTTPPQTRRRQVFRYVVPVDYKPHVIHLTNDPLHVSCTQMIDEVEFWAEHDTDAAEYPAVFQVVGTGHPLPDGAVYVGTCPRVRGIVWHLYRLPVEHPGASPSTPDPRED